MATDAPPEDDQIVDTLRFLLREAEAKRIVFLVASVGHVADPAPGPSLLDLGPIPTSTSKPPTPKARSFKVSVAGFLGPIAEGLHPAALAGAYADVEKGLLFARDAVSRRVATIGDAALPAGGRKS